MLSFLESVGEKTGLPLEILNGGFRVINFNNNSVYIEGYKNIVSFEDNEIVIKLKKGIVKISGNKLKIKSMNDNEIIVVGQISVVENS